MSMVVNGVEIPKNCAECVAGTYEYNDNDERCFVCGFIKSQHPWECEHAEIDGIDTTKMRAHFCPIAEVATPHWIPVTKEEMFKAGYEGREIRFKVDGRLFAIRELAQ